MMKTATLMTMTSIDNHRRFPREIAFVQLLTTKWRRALKAPLRTEVKKLKGDKFSGLGFIFCRSNKALVSS